MGLWLSETKTAGLWKGGLWKSQQGSPYAFNLDLTTSKDTVTGLAITGTPTITDGWLTVDDSLYLDDTFYNFPLLYQSLTGEVESGVIV